MSCWVLCKVVTLSTPRTKTCPWGPGPVGRADFHPCDEDLSLGAPDLKSCAFGIHRVWLRYRAALAAIFADGSSDCRLTSRFAGVRRMSCKRKIMRDRTGFRTTPSYAPSCVRACPQISSPRPVFPPGRWEDRLLLTSSARVAKALRGFLPGPRSTRTGRSHSPLAGDRCGQRRRPTGPATGPDCRRGS